LVGLNVGLAATITVAIIGLAWAGLWRRANTAAQEAKRQGEENRNYVGVALEAMTATVLSVGNHSTILSLMASNTSVTAAGLASILERDARYMGKSLEEIRLLTGSPVKRLSAAQQLASGVGDYDSLRLMEWCADHYDDARLEPSCRRLKTVLRRDGVWHATL